MRAVRAGHRLEGARPRKPRVSPVEAVGDSMAWWPGEPSGSQEPVSTPMLTGPQVGVLPVGSTRGLYLPAAHACFEAQGQWEEPHLPAWPQKPPAVRGLNLASGFPRPKGEGV